MSGTKEGGLKTAVTVKSKYGSNYYALIGAVGGRRGHTGGFYKNRALASEAGRKGGKNRWKINNPNEGEKGIE